jgi:spoIIIJ-associated protein
LDEAEMSERRTSLEIIAPSIEEAVAKGLDELGLPEEAVDIEVLDTGTRGLFGLGSRQARVRLTIKAGPLEYQATDKTAQIVVPPEPASIESISSTPETPEPVTPKIEVTDREEERIELETRFSAPAAEVTPDQSEAVLADDEFVCRVARETVQELLEKMKVRAQVTAHFGEPDDARSKAPLLVDVRGDDLSILIGPKAETLNALQYISGLMISKELGRSVPLVLDVEGYRARRTQQIRQLARRMAEQAVRTGRRQALEPMPASERRLVHIELRDHPQVTTESIGEDPRRKVTIIPK